MVLVEGLEIWDISDYRLRPHLIVISVGSLTKHNGNDIENLLPKYKFTLSQVFPSCICCATWTRYSITGFQRTALSKNGVKDLLL